MSRQQKKCRKFVLCIFHLIERSFKTKSYVVRYAMFMDLYAYQYAFVIFLQ